MTEPHLDARGEARAALNSTVADFGTRVLSDPRMLRSRMSDLLPDLPRERYLLVAAAEADVAGELTQHVQSQHLDPEAAVAMVARKLCDSQSIQMPSSTWVTTAYAQALGYPVRSDAPLAPPPAQPDPLPPAVDPNQAPTGSPLLQAASPPLAATIGAADYAAYAPPQAPAGGDAYVAHPPSAGSDGYIAAPPPYIPPPPAGGAWSAPPSPPAGGAGYAPPSPPTGGGWSAPPQAPGAGQAPPAAVPPQGSSPWVQPTPPAKRRNRWPLFAGVGVVVVGLVVGLLVWAPWHKVPVAPTALRGQSPTATSVLVSWAPSKGGATIDHYLVLRDGAQVGSVPASQASYLDQGLSPGTIHRYKIIAVSGTQQSQPSLSVAVRTITPSPTGLVVDQATWTSVQFHWSAPPNSPAPSMYAIFVNGAAGPTVPGGTTSYTDTGLTLATAYQYQVVAVWGSHQSDRSRVLAVTTLAAPLQGSVPLNVKTLTTPGGGASLHPGESWSDSWTFNPTCTANGCIMTVNGEWAPPNLTTVSWTVHLTSSGPYYVGSGTASITSCGSVNVKNTVSLRITPDSGAVNKGAWSSWHGTEVVSSPYTNENSTTYCPTQSWTFSLTGST